MSPPSAYDALASRDAEVLLQFIKANTTASAAIELGDAYHRLAIQRPAETDTYAATLRTMLDAPDIPVIKSKDHTGNTKELTVAGLLSRHLHGVLSAILHEKVDLTIQPHNNYIVASVISGTAIRYRLCESSMQDGEVMRGLHFADSDFESYWGPETYEINALGACVHLLIGGNRMYTFGQIGYRNSEVLPALEAIKQEGVIKHLAGLKILEVTIQQAKTGFEKDLTLQEIWDILFSEI